jgi:hypothetical protein
MKMKNGIEKDGIQDILARSAVQAGRNGELRVVVIHSSAVTCSHGIALEVWESWRMMGESRDLTGEVR